jgi:hypothetical protein
MGEFIYPEEQSQVWSLFVNTMERFFAVQLGDICIENAVARNIFSASGTH